ncbi:MAG: hypothetical protein ABF306_08400 [Nocardioides marinisabuli]|uniref:hypothetical protein n=1 Tax=Nocardioides marinisabuli TaxID=419476 RepID=UPI003218E27E
MTRTRRGLVAAVTSLALTGAAAGAAVAGDDDVLRRGSCTGSTDWKMKAGPDDGRIEVEAEIDSDRVGQTWRWVLRHDGAVVARGKSRTKGPSGSFEVDRRTADHKGTDSFRFKAKHQGSGERCVGRVRR